MDKKEYAAISLIVAKSRKFLDDTFRFMKENGLIDQGYELRLQIDEMGDIKKQMECDYLLSVELNKDSRFVSRKKWEQTASCQWNKDGKGWTILYDPCGKTEILPEDDQLEPGTDLNGLESGTYSEGETAENSPKPGDRGMWFHADDNDPPMVCDGDLNGSMAESE